VPARTGLFLPSTGSRKCRIRPSENLFRGKGGRNGEVIQPENRIEMDFHPQNVFSLTCTVFIPGSSCFFRFPKSVLDKEKDLGKNHRSWNNGTALPGKVSAHEQNNKKVVDC
jgi:hypothetical protein